MLLRKLPNDSIFLPVPHLAVVLQDTPPTDTTLYKFRGGQLKVLSVIAFPLSVTRRTAELTLWLRIFSITKFTSPGMLYF